MEETTESRETAKNSISILNEFCIRFKLGIPLYHLVAENGAAFAKTFEMQVSLSSLALKSSGSGSTKMNAKHKAAENLIDQICEAAESNSGLKDYTNSDVLQFYEYLKPFRIANEVPSIPDLTDRPALLKDWCATNNFPSPVYTVKSAEGPAHDRTFVMVCQLLTYETLGEGKSKKLASRLAADRMLQLVSSPVEVGQPTL